MQVSHELFIPQSLASQFYDSGAAKNLVGLFGISADMMTVAATADALGAQLNADGPLDQILAQSHTWHIVVRYARCFMSDAGRSASLNDRDVAALNDSDFESLHKGLMERRHKTFAHAGEHCSDHLVVHLLVDDERGLVMTSTPALEGPGPIADPEQPGLIARLARALKDSADKRMEKAAAAVDKELAGDAGKTLLATLRANLGRHATPQQQAMSEMVRLGIR
jgi:hypothetical protein